MRINVVLKYLGEFQVNASGRTDDRYLYALEYDGHTVSGVFTMGIGLRKYNQAVGEKEPLMPRKALPHLIESLVLDYSLVRGLTDEREMMYELGEAGLSLTMREVLSVSRQLKDLSDLFRALPHDVEKALIEAEDSDDYESFVANHITLR